MIIMIAGANYTYNFDRAENLIDYHFEKLLHYNLLENLFDDNRLEINSIIRRPPGGATKLLRQRF